MPQENKAKSSDDNLYIGTSAAEILHLVRLPPEEDATDPSATYILASRLQPSGYGAQQDALGGRGVRQILLLPQVLKACVLCNGVVSFYSLPELSPAFPNREPTGVQWIGGLDENEQDSGGNTEGSVVMIADMKRIRLVRVGEKLRPLKTTIEYPGCLRSSRRDTIACVADNKSYALLEVEHQQKIPLFPISSAPLENESPNPDNNTRKGSPQSRGTGSATPSHGRSTSMGDLLSTTADRSGSPRPQSSVDGRLKPPGLNYVPERNLDETETTQNAERSRPISRQRSSTEVLSTSPLIGTITKTITKDLKPHIISPFPSEFMLTTGVSETEPGVGMFVNLDGDVVRGTVGFTSYPEALVVENFEPEASIPAGDVDGKERILALLKKTTTKNVSSRCIEIQRLPGNDVSPPTWLDVPDSSSDLEDSGLLKCLSLHNYRFVEVSELLQSVPFRANEQYSFNRDSSATKDSQARVDAKQAEQKKAISESQSGLSSRTEISNEHIQKRLKEEMKFVKQFGIATTRTLLWHGQRLWQILENPLILQLESKIQIATSQGDHTDIQPEKLHEIMTSLRSQEPRNETDFLTINFVRQKLGLLLFLHLQTLMDSESELAGQQITTENALHESGLDPRVILLLLPPLATEVHQGKQGLWLPRGLVDLTKGFKSPIHSFQDAPLEFWLMIRHYLTLWQEKKGYGSISDEKLVFDSVDAALLHILLFLDAALPQGSGIQTSTRAKLNNVVDNWKGDFQIAISCLEKYHRLYLLSRLYQSRKQSKDVLVTWKRIFEGEKDVEYGPTNLEELEARIKVYLTVIRDQTLVQEYGIWLAQRNPTLGVQIFADDSSRVKFSPQQVIPMLKRDAPGAVQQYLEFLVFEKNLDQYADDLIGYYLDSVLNVLENSEQARDSLAQTYSTYRALTSPKPTYLNFVRENAPPDSWWQSRMRLLQLLGSGGYATSATAGKELTYSIPKVLERLAPFSSYLVSESIILDARQGKHKEALRLLVHGLGDYDTAVRYCYFGSPAPSSSTTIDVSALPPRSLQQELFTALFHEFLMIVDIEERLEQTSQLLGKFATWFDPLQIIATVPDDWNIAMLAEFLLRSFRAATSERNEAVIVKALSAAQNLQSQAEFIEICEKNGATIESEGGIRLTNTAAERNEDVDTVT